MAPEYLSDFRPEVLGGLTLDEMVQNRMVISPGYLGVALAEASEFLSTVPGPHLNQRREGLRDWLNFWINHLSKFSPESTTLTPSVKLQRNLVDLAAAVEVDRSHGLTSGVLLLATGEGHAGHRSAAEYMSGVVDKVVYLFEPDSYFGQNPGRRRPFLPRTVILSLWDYWPYVGYTGMIPPRDVTEDMNVFYADVVRRTGVDLSFTTRGDPNLATKIRRGRTFDIRSIIPLTDTMQTSQEQKDLGQRSILMI
ncbi:hypothetical protein A2W15_04605 [Candidatus Woesebacteria bacterium RBG_16_41_13]|nr:MAG: hypothetical protein A2W15_04605 [Candidatus Woesebacteria bacterium RBG_16_41_13]